MARPKKQTVDYYPHSVKGGKTLFILESRWGNDGYAFLHKLMETLCETAGHCLDYNDLAQREYLLAKTRLTDEMAREIIKTLCDLGKVDAELWTVDNRVWYQNLVDNIKDAYKKRIDLFPQKPSLRIRKSDSCGFPATETQQRPVSGDGSTESKVKKSKVKDIRDSGIIPTGNDQLDDAIKSFVEMRTKIKKPMTDNAVGLLIKKLNRMTAVMDEQIAILEQSTINCWSDVYALKDNSGNQHQAQRTINLPPETAFDLVRSTLEKNRNGVAFEPLPKPAARAAGRLMRKFQDGSVTMAEFAAAYREECDSA